MVIHFNPPWRRELRVKLTGPEVAQGGKEEKKKK
jgi:hypothetical protein